MTFQDFQKIFIKMFYFLTRIINLGILLPWDLGEIIHKAIRVVVLISSCRRWFRGLEIQNDIYQIMIANVCFNHATIKLTRAELEVMMTSVKVSDVAVTLVGSVISCFIFKLLHKSFNKIQ